MEQTTLKYLRVLIPGIICLLGLYPTYIHYFGDVYDIKSLDVTYLTLICILLGSIYHYLGLRRFFISSSLQDIDKNILNGLVKIYPRTLNEKQINFLKDSGKFKHVFYRLIDNDESLKKKAANVYFNGIFWTSTADLFLLSLFFFLLYTFLYVFQLTTIPSLGRLSLMFFLICVLSPILHLLSVKKHLTLGDEQLKYIDTQLKEEAGKYIDKVLQQLPSTSAIEGPESNKPDKEGIPK